MSEINKAAKDASEECIAIAEVLNNKADTLEVLRTVFG